LQHEGGIAHLLRTSTLRGATTGVELTARLHALFRRNAGWAEVLHINWLQCVLGAIGLRQPVLATVLGSDLALLDRAPIRLAVRAALRHRRSVLCPNAEWMVEPLRNALGASVEIRTVPFGLDEFWFEVSPRRTAGRKVWLTVLRVTHRKIGALFEWTRDIDRSLHEFHLFGPLQEPVEIPDWITYHGPVSPQSLAHDWYPIAAGMISMSLHDEGRPQVLLEAMAAGVPVLCSRTRAHTDLLGNSGAGLLAATREEFLAGIEACGQPGQAGRMTRVARDLMRSAYGTWSDCARRYGALYDLLLDDGKPCVS
jgi:glycosyltransferase involved in cell wall biosynthesis